ncbi:hypothetical protein BH09BAC5_BH09BAC5_13670 [soil metagenome]
MRKLGFFLLFILAKNSVAQNTFHAGLIAGVNGSQIHGNSYSGFNQAGIVGGGFVCSDPKANAYFQIEIQYSMKGSRKIAHPDKGDYDIFELRMNYVEVPFLARVNFRKLYFEIGETVGFLAGIREWDDYGEIQPTGFRKWETALIIGTGINLNDYWYADLRYTNSIIPVKKFATPLYYPNYLSNLFNKGMYNNVLGLTLAYRIHKKETNE